MHSLFSTAHLPSPPTNSSVSPTPTHAHNTSPLEAIASLWVHDRERISKSGASLPTSEPHIVSPTEAIVSGPGNAIGSFDDAFLSLLPESSSMSTFNASSNVNQDFGLYNDLGFDLDAELARVGFDESGPSIPASAFSYTAMSSCSPIQAGFGSDYDRHPYGYNVGSQPRGYT